VNRVWNCKDCTTPYAVGLPACPNCGGQDYWKGMPDVPKITVSGGPSDATQRPGEGEFFQADPESAPVEDTGGLEATAGASPEGESELEAVKRPALGDEKAKWVAYAVAVNGIITDGQGDPPMTDDEVRLTSTTKQTLIDTYSQYGE
jgi:hypothetical protein